MKKLIFAAICAVALMSLSSCSTLQQSARTQNVRNYMASAVVGELEVSKDKITFTYNPPKAVRKLGKQNCINMAISEALKKYGSGDILVETQEAIVTKYGFGRKIKSVKVTGYPATYVKFTPTDKKVVEEIILNGTEKAGTVKLITK